MKTDAAKEAGQEVHSCLESLRIAGSDEPAVRVEDGNEGADLPKQDATYGEEALPFEYRFKTRAW